MKKLINIKRKINYSGLNFRIGIDIGGTFTDIVLSLENGEILTKKVNSTPKDYSIGAVNGLKFLIRQNGLNFKNAKDVIHATTIATNTILEAKGAETALITTCGFRDVLEFRRVRFPELYNLQYAKPKPLIERRKRFEIKERISAKGLIKVPLNEKEVKILGKIIRKENVKSVAICFLHSYLNPIHEIRTKEIISAMLPKDTFISTSYEVLPEIREYERTSTTVINAYLGPVIKNYLSSFSSRLAEIDIKVPCYVMQSSGGQMTFESAMEKPAYLLESGPAAGVVAASELAKEKNINKAITLDIGGTTAKTAILEDFEPKRTSEYEVGSGINLSSKLTRGAGYAVKLPFIDISEIGAGGGSVVWFDEGGLLKVGPKSSGSYPGPIAYNLGGKDITLTDANITLGYLNPKALLGGTMPINGKLSNLAIKNELSKKLNMSVFEAANGVLKIAVGNMVRAVKSVTTYQGRDPRDFTLIVYGGNGSLLATSIAEDLNINQILIPKNAGVLSAQGLLFAQTTYEMVKSFQSLLIDLELSKLNRAFNELLTELRKKFVIQGLKKTDLKETFYLDLRYLGQAYELSIKINKKHLLQINKISDLFHKEHKKFYGNSSPNEKVELVSLRASISKKGHKNNQLFKTFNFKNSKNARTIYLPKPHGKIRANIFLGREEIGKKALDGPLIIEEYDSTILVPFNWIVSVDERKNVLLKKRK